MSVCVVTVNGVSSSFLFKSCIVLDTAITEGSLSTFDEDEDDEDDDIDT